jgi:hypothetical protein
MDINTFCKGMESETLNDYILNLSRKIEAEKDRWFFDIVNNKLIHPIEGEITKEKLYAANVTLNFEVYPNITDEKMWIEQNGVKVGSALIVQTNTDLNKGSYGFTIKFE